MVDDEKSLEGYKFLAQIHRQERWERAKHEWKLFLEVFLAYASLVGALLAKHLNIKVPCWWWGYSATWYLSGVVIVCFFSLLALIQHGHYRDLSIAESAEENIRALLGNRSVGRRTTPLTSPGCRPCKRIFYWLVQAGMFVPFAIAATFLFTRLG